MESNKQAKKTHWYSLSKIAQGTTSPVNPTTIAEYEKKIEELYKVLVHPLFGSLRDRDAWKKIEENSKKLSIEDTAGEMYEKIIKKTPLDEVDENKALKPFIDNYLGKKFPNKKKGPGAKKEGVPDLATIDLEDDDEVTSALADIDKVKKDFHFKFNPNNDQHLKNIIGLGIESGKNRFYEEIVSKKDSKTKTSPFLAMDWGKGISEVTSKVMGEFPQIKDLLSKTIYGSQVDIIFDFADMISFLFCIKSSEVRSASKGVLSSICERFIYHLYQIAPNWTKIKTFTNLQTLGRDSGDELTSTKDVYEEGCSYGENQFFSKVYNESGQDGKYFIDNIGTMGSNGVTKALEIMRNIRPQIENLSKSNAVSDENIKQFVACATFLLSILYSNAISNKPGEIKKLYDHNVYLMSRIINDWSTIPELEKLGKLQSNDMNNVSTVPDVATIKQAFLDGINSGLTKLNNAKNDQKIKWGDFNKGYQVAFNYMNSKINDVISIVSQFGKKFNIKNLTPFAQEATNLIGLIKGGATGVGYDLKSVIKSNFRTLDTLWNNWEKTRLFDELNSIGINGGYSSGFGAQQSLEIVRKLAPKAIEKIFTELNNNPELEKISPEGFKSLRGNNWLIGDPQRLEIAFKRDMVTPESIVFAKETISRAKNVRASDPNKQADFILHMVSAWCSGYAKKEDLELYNDNNLAEKYLKNEDDATKESLPSSSEIEIDKKSKIKMQPGVYAEPLFIGTISAICGILFQIGSNQENLPMDY